MAQGTLNKFGILPIPDLIAPVSLRMVFVLFSLPWYSLPTLSTPNLLICSSLIPSLVTFSSMLTIIHNGVDTKLRLDWQVGGRWRIIYILSNISWRETKMMEKKDSMTDFKIQENGAGIICTYSRWTNASQDGLIVCFVIWRCIGFDFRHPLLNTPPSI